MRVGINATSLNDRPSGARQRFVGLYGALFRSRPDNDYIIYEPRDCRVASWFADLPNVSGVATRLPSAGRWSRFMGGIGLWRRLLANDRLDCFEALHLPLIAAPDCPTILTIHDARPVLADVPRVRRAIYGRILRGALRRADAVITVSDAMREELLLLQPGASVTTIYNGIEEEAFSSPVDGRGAASGRPFLLAVGHFEARKNYATLLRAFALIADRDQQLDLLLVGRDGGELLRTLSLVSEFGLTDRVRLLHDVEDGALVAYYRTASLLVFPSTYEGFGIPILEAMAAGTPMALSALPVFHELTQGRAAFFDPEDAEEMARVILALLRSPSRLDLQRTFGRERLADFAFPRLAERLDALHRDVVSKAGLPPVASDSRLTRGARGASERPS